jgi:hypothetical protein
LHPQLDVDGLVVERLMRAAVIHQRDGGAVLQPDLHLERCLPERDLRQGERRRGGGLAISSSVTVGEAAIQRGAREVGDL